MINQDDIPVENPDTEELLVKSSNKGKSKEPDNEDIKLTILNGEQSNNSVTINIKPDSDNRISYSVSNKGKAPLKVYTEPASSMASDMGGEPDGLSISTSIITDTMDTNINNNNNNHRQSLPPSLRNKRFSYNTPNNSSAIQWNSTNSGTFSNNITTSIHSSPSLNHMGSTSSSNNNRPNLASYPFSGSFGDLLGLTNNAAQVLALNGSVNANANSSPNNETIPTPSSRHNSFSSNLQQNFYRLGLSDTINIETVDPSSDTAENNERPSQVGPGENAWLLFRIYAIFRFVWSLIFSTLYLVHFIKGSKSCDSKIFKFSIVFTVVLLVQALSSLFLIIYLPTSITRYTNVVRRRVVISNRAWKVTANSFVAEIIMIVIGSILLFNKDPSCSTSGNLAYVNITKVIVLIVICFFTLICFPLFIIPCTCTFKLLPKYRGISNKVLKRFNSFRYNPTEEVDEENAPSCSICMENYEPGARIKRLPCNHEFHPDCIIPWLETNNSCPICRQTFT